MNGVASIANWYCCAALSDHGTACGIFCVRAGHDASIAYWNISAAP